MSELLKSRFKTWDNVERLMNSELYLNDLHDEEQLSPIQDEVRNILFGNDVKLGFNRTVLEEK